MSTRSATWSVSAEFIIERTAPSDILDINKNMLLINKLINARTHRICNTVQPHSSYQKERCEIAGQTGIREGSVGPPPGIIIMQLKAPAGPCATTEIFMLNSAMTDLDTTRRSTSRRRRGTRYLWWYGRWVSCRKSSSRRHIRGWVSTCGGYQWIQWSLSGHCGYYNMDRRSFIYWLTDSFCATAHHTSPSRLR